MFNFWSLLRLKTKKTNKERKDFNIKYLLYLGFRWYYAKPGNGRVKFGQNCFACQNVLVWCAYSFVITHFVIS